MSSKPAGIHEVGSNLHKADSRFPGSQASGEFLGTQVTVVFFSESVGVNFGFTLGIFETLSSLVGVVQLPR